MKKVVVIGDGVAGLAAAFAAKRGGAEVTIVGRGAGATALTSGAIDDRPWREARNEDESGSELEDDARALVDAFEIWDVGPRRALLATSPGLVRSARGRDRSLLDLSSLSEGKLLVASAPRASWDASAIARCLATSERVRALRLEVEVLDAPALRFDDERRIADMDLAARHDDPERLGWLAARLREGAAKTGARVAGVLVGPWLGVARPRAEAASKLAGFAIGEALFGVGGPAGMRFESARDRLVASLGVEKISERAARVSNESRLDVELSSGRSLACDAVVLAIGGVAGGGVVYAPPDHWAGADAPTRITPPFALSLDAPVSLSEVASSIHGPELDATAWPSPGREGALERVGVHQDGPHVARGIRVAGDVVANKPRTVLAALRSGLAAGRAAASSRATS